MAAAEDGGGPRFAIYFAPPEDSALWALGNDWLGRDAATGAPRRRPAADGFSAARLDAITRTAAGYGFHATLKPPFALAEGESADALIAAAEAFAAGRAGFRAPPLAVGAIDGFVALVPSGPSADLDRLAADCVRDFDSFRAPPSPADLRRRRRAGLTDAEEALLRRWGYPYVMEAWRFHMTLSGRLDDVERERLMAVLAPLFRPVSAEPLIVDAISLFRQDDRSAPFRLMRRFPFAGSPAR